MSTEFFRKFADMITEAERPGTSKPGKEFRDSAYRDIR